MFFPVGEQIEMQVLEHNEIPEVEAPELPAPQPGQLINIGVLILTIIKAEIDFAIQLSWQVCIV